MSRRSPAGCGRCSTTEELIDQAITQAYEGSTRRDEQQQSELAVIQGKLAETRAAMDRYFRAFEAGTMPEDTCAPRIASLTKQTKALEARARRTRSWKTTSSPSAPPPPNSTLYRQLRDALNDSIPAAPRPSFKP